MLGSHDPRVGQYGAQLCLDLWAPRIMFSGGVGNLTKGKLGPDVRTIKGDANPVISWKHELNTLDSGEEERETIARYWHYEK